MPCERAAQGDTDDQGRDGSYAAAKAMEHQGLLVTTEAERKAQNKFSRRAFENLKILVCKTMRQ